jgi:putative two-component system response regulator
MVTTAVDTRGNILIVDDEENLRKILFRKLTKEGYTCSEASNAKEALQRLGKYTIDLVILDIKMPGKSGTDLLPEIKAGYPDIAVIMATAVTESSTIIDCMKDGAYDYIPKPFNFDDVLSAIDRALDKRKLELMLKEYKLSLEDKVDSQTKELRELYLGAIKSLVFALEAKDKYTAGHSRRVALIAEIIGKGLNLPEDELEDLRWAALLHDVGKIAVDPNIQNKPGKLTSEEYAHIMRHTQVGPTIVKPVANEKIVEMIRHHHDHYNGKGFQQTISGEDIPFGSRILAVADAFDAMTSNRPYRKAKPVKEAMNEILSCRGEQFDPKIVDVFLKLSLSKLLSSQAFVEDSLDSEI